MNYSETTAPQNRKSLHKSLLHWFLFLSLFPLAVAVWSGYNQAENGLREKVIDNLTQSANLKAKFIQNWFNYRFMDLKANTENLHNVDLVRELQKIFIEAGSDITRYMLNKKRTQLFDKHGQDISAFLHSYDYVNNVYLINTQGRILFSLPNKSNIGESVFTDQFLGTRFSKSVRRTLENKESIFSDIERTTLFGNKLAGFLTAPLRDSRGLLVGAIAIQIDLERIITMMLSKDQTTDIAHYIVGYDGKLRTQMQLDSVDEVLQREIDTEQFRLWWTEHGDKGIQPDNQQETAFEYTGPNGRDVIGIHKTVRVPGVKWVVITEMDADDAFASAYDLAATIAALFMLTAIAVFVAAHFISLRITRPIVKLAEVSKAVANGSRGQKVYVDSDNEIGMLSNAFNHMLETNLSHEKALEHYNAELINALKDLEQQKFALDQHAIVAITDVKGNITFANNKFCEISGYSREELIGNNHRILKSGVHDENYFREMYRTIASGHVWHGEICNIAKDGHPYWVDTTIVPTTGDNGKPSSYIAMRTDISILKETERNLLDAKEAAEAANKQKSEFLANMSHEIRTPMNGIIGMTGLLQDTRLNPKQLSYTNATMSSAESLLTIINDILDFSKIEAGKLELELVPFDLQGIAEDVVELMSLKTRKKGVDLLLRYKPGSDRFVIGDSGRVRQILLNLLSNAVKFTESGHILLTIESQLSENNISTFHFSVEDTGVGISEENITHIFNKFDQEDNSTTRKYGGTGLGLAICKELCLMMDGDIKVESEKDKGSTFSFQINLERAENNRDILTELDNYEQLKGLSVLIIDDAEIARTILSEQLTSLGMKTTCTDSAKDALRKLSTVQDKDYDVIITDFHMPEMDGKMLAKEMKTLELHEDSVLVFFTSSQLKDDGDSLKSQGFDAYITKPAHPSEVPQILSLVWDAKKRNIDIPLVTRFTLQQARSGGLKKPVFEGVQILVVEDNPINLVVASELLEGYGCAVTPAGNGLEALTLVRDRDFDLIFMDCQMPEMDGFEATQRVKELQEKGIISKTPVVALTANAMKEDRDRCTAAGMDDYISKPVTQGSMEKVLRKWLSTKLKEGVGSEFSILTEQQSQSGYGVEPLNFDTLEILRKLLKDKFEPAITQCIDNMCEFLGEIDKAIDQEEVDALERAAHSLKGAAAQVGAEQLRDVAREIEELASRGNIVETKQYVQELKEKHDVVEKMLADQLSDNDSFSSAVGH